MARLSLEKGQVYTLEHCSQIPWIITKKLWTELLIAPVHVTGSNCSGTKHERQSNGKGWKVQVFHSILRHKLPFGLETILTTQLNPKDQRTISRWMDIEASYISPYNGNWLCQVPNLETTSTRQREYFLPISWSDFTGHATGSAPVSTLGGCLKCSNVLGPRTLGPRSS